MDLYTFYHTVGGDYQQTLSRLPSDRMIRKFVLRFLQDPAFQELEQSMACGDLVTAFRAAHTLKGTAATLGLGRLTGAAGALTEALRNTVSLPDPALLAAVEQSYAQTVAAIQTLDT